MLVVCGFISLWHMPLFFLLAGWSAFASLSTGDALPHLERGGPDGGLVFFGTHARDGVLYEILGEDGKPLANVTIETLVADWKANA